MILEVFSWRWGHNDTYRIDRTPKGWHVSHMAINGTCDKQGNPYLFKNLKQDCICYPSKLGYAMESLWEKAEREALDSDEIQKHLDVIGQWIQSTEKGTPKAIFE